MLRYAVNRLVQAVFLLWAVITFTFFLIHSAPGLPTIAVSQEQSQAGRDRVIAELGLDQPLTVQYTRWLSNTVRGDFGSSLTYSGTSITKLIKGSLIPTLLLSGTAFVFAVGFSIPLGILAAVYRSSIVDYLISVLSALGLALPGFWLGLLLIIVFGIQFRWLPTSGYVSSGSDSGVFDMLRHLILPVSALCMGLLGPLTRQMRSSMLDVLHQDYIRTARAKGMPTRIVLFRHALKNAMFPMITLMGTQIPSLAGGAAVIESLFAWPGMGRLAVDSAFQRDYPTVMGITIVVAGLAIASNLMVDLLYAWFDPRVRLSS